MDNRMLHDFVPASVGALDSLLNRRIATARNSADVDHWLHVKVDVQRRLVAVPPDCLEREARAAIDVLGNQLGALNAGRAS